MNGEIYVAEESKQNDKSRCQNLRHDDASFNADDVAIGNVMQRSPLCLLRNVEVGWRDRGTKEVGSIWWFLRKKFDSESQCKILVGGVSKHSIYISVPDLVYQILPSFFRTWTL